MTQGDTILIASLASKQAQGIYALANNYGGLLARLILQPLEESSRSYFGKLLATVDRDPSKDSVTRASTSLHTLLRIYVLLSVIVLAIGPTTAPLLLHIVAGHRWTASGAGDVLALYCYYIPLLAINGVTEAFVSSVARETELNRQSLWMLAFSAAFAVAAFIFLRIFDMGAEGLVWANSLNMVFRIIWSTSFIGAYLRRHGADLEIASLIPRPMTMALGVLVHALLMQMQSTFQGGIWDFLQIGVVTAIFGIIL